MLTDYDAKIHKTLLITKQSINYFLCSACFNISVYKVILKSRIFAPDLQHKRMNNSISLFLSLSLNIKGGQCFLEIAMSTLLYIYI